MNSEYNNYKGKIAEVIVEVFFSKHGRVVQKYGVENSINYLAHIDREFKNNNAKDIISKVMTMPDFIIIDEPKKQIYFIEVKYRTFKDNKAFEQSLQDDGDIFKEASKYEKLWDGRTYIFLIAKIGSNVCSYLATANSITMNNFIDPLEKSSWIDKNILKEYNTLVEEVFNA